MKVKKNLTTELTELTLRCSSSIETYNYFLIRITDTSYFIALHVSISNLRYFAFPLYIYIYYLYLYVDPQL